MVDKRFKLINMIENTLENKAKFFALYWGQDIAKEYNDDLTIPVEPHIAEWAKEWYLELKHLSDITDEEAIMVAHLHYGKSWKYLIDRSEGRYIRNVKKYVLYDIEWSSLTIIDFLRSKGYALPWLGVSIDQLVEWGWIKLIK